MALLNHGIICNKHAKFPSIWRRAFDHCARFFIAATKGFWRAALTADIVIAAGADLTGPLTPNGSYSWLKFALSIGLDVAQTLENGDIVKLGSGGRGADKVTAEQQGIQRR
jgi:hypothetical protein